jgi:hypothetical protein
MPESKQKAMSRAKSLHYPQKNVVKSKTGGYYIAPRGLHHVKARHAYADLRIEGYTKESAARLAHYIDSKL